MLTQIGVVLGLGFIAKQRSGFGFDYMSLAIMRGNDPRTLQASDLNLQGYHFTLHFKPLQLVSEQIISTVFYQIQKSKKKASPISNTDANHS